MERKIRTITFGFGFDEYLQATISQLGILSSKQSFKGYQGSIMDKFMLQLVMDTLKVDGKVIDFDVDKVFYESNNSVKVNKALGVDEEERDIMLTSLFLNTIGQVAGEIEIIEDMDTVVDSYFIIFNKTILKEN